MHSNSLLNFSLGSRAFRLVALLSTFLPLALSAASPKITVDPKTGQVLVETDRYNARLEGGTLTWLYSKLSKRSLIGDEKPAEKMGNLAGLLVEDHPKEEPIWLTPLLKGDELSKVEVNGTSVTFQGLGVGGKLRPNTALTVDVGVDPKSGDLLVTTSGTAGQECVVGAGFAFSGLMQKYIDYVAGGGGAIEHGDTEGQYALLRGNMEWSNMTMSKRVGPRGSLWNAPVTVLASEEDPNAAFAVWCEDDIPKYKMRLGGRDGLTYATWEEPPYDDNRAALSVTWRINVFDKGWTAAAKPYADSLVPRGFTKGKAPWAKDISVVLSLPNMTQSWIEVVERTFPPEDRKHVMLKAEDWREPPFDHDMWNYAPRADFIKDAPGARTAGFHTMVYFNPLFLWGDPKSIADEKERAAVKKMQEYVILDPLGKEPIEMGIINPAYEPWRRNRVDAAANVFKNYGVEGLYLDCAYLFLPDGRGRVEGMTVYQGMAAMMEGFRKAKPDLYLGSEMANELMARWTDFSLHMGLAWAPTYELVKARSSHPIVNYLYRDVMGTITHVQSPYDNSRSFHAAEEIAERTGQICAGTPGFGEWEAKTQSPGTKLWLAKAKIFAHRGLRPWFPDKWEPNVMSYFKATDGTVFVYEETDYGSRFVERTAKGPVIHYGRAWKTDQVKTNDGVLLDAIGRKDDGTWIGLDSMGTTEMGFEALDKSQGRKNAGRGYVLFPASSPQAHVESRFRISELPPGVKIAKFDVADTLTTIELVAKEGTEAAIRVVSSRPLVRVAAPGRPSIPFTKGAQNTLTVPLNQPVAFVLEDGYIAPFEYGGNYKVPLPAGLGVNPDSPAITYTLGDWDQKWNSPIIGPVNPRPGSVYLLPFKARKTTNQDASLLVALVSMGTQGDKFFSSVGSLKVDADKLQDMTHAGLRNTSMELAWDRQMGLRMFCANPVVTPPAVEVTDLKDIQFFRPELGISNSNLIALGVVKAGQPSAASAVQRIFNSQTGTAASSPGSVPSPADAPVSDGIWRTILYGVAHISAPAEPAYLQKIDDVGVELVGPQAAMFELKGEHATPDGLGIKLLGASGKPGLLGGPQPESESYTVQFRGASQPGKYTATVRIVTQAGNMGTLSKGEAGQPLINLSYVDIPVTVEVR
ncbi:hypothetical protein BH09VER1_BH09VER1_36460 [soil metagenome]